MMSCDGSDRDSWDGYCEGRVGTVYGLTITFVGHSRAFRYPLCVLRRVNYFDPLIFNIFSPYTHSRTENESHERLSQGTGS